MTGRSLDLTDGFAGLGDDVYDALIRSHEGLTTDESAALNARLVLILANQVRDPGAVMDAIRLAREAGSKAEPPG